MRDNIPKIIRENEKTPVTRILRAGEYKKELKRKLQEEVREVADAKTKAALIDELADVQEVLNAVYAAYDIACSDVTNAARKKRKKCGAFNKRIFLETVT